MWQNLIETLDKLGEVYGSLVKLGERKRDALVAIDMQELSKILDEEQLLAAKVQKLEQRRLEILRSLSQADETLTDKTRAKDLYNSAPADLREKFFALHERLSKNVERALTLRDNNTVLARCALDAVQGQLNRLSGAAVEPTYSGKGAESVTHDKKFDFKA